MGARDVTTLERIDSSYAREGRQRMFCVCVCVCESLHQARRPVRMDVMARGIRIESVEKHGGNVKRK